MQHKELRIALVCYGGVSLAVYMHGVTKELWKLARASRSFHSGQHCIDGSEAVYCRLLERLERERGLRLRILPDILSGASAGGINAVFLAEAIHSGRSLEPLTDLWLSAADVDRLLDPDARPWSRFAKFWAAPLVHFVLTRPGNAVSESVAPETRAEVRAKLSRFIRSRWFAPPFSGIGFSRLLCGALEAMRSVPAGEPLLPPRHPLDLFVTATDFRGYREMLRLHSPPMIEESEHRMPVGFHSRTPETGGQGLADPLELVFAARATASFPGAFPPLQIAEIEELAREGRQEWAGRDAFLERIMPAHVRQGDVDHVSLIDGSVLVNAPFAEAAAALNQRPVQREVDRRFVYIDPRPDRGSGGDRTRPVGFFSAILGSLSTIPREQPIRDNLEALGAQSRVAERTQRILAALQPDVERTVERLFGRTLFMGKLTPRRLNSWRAKAQQAAAEQAGYAFHGYAQAKFNGIIDRLARTVHAAVPHLLLPDHISIADQLRAELTARGLVSLSDERKGIGASPEAIMFFRNHDIAFRIRRLRLLSQRLARDPVFADASERQDREAARALVFNALSRYIERERTASLGPDFEELAERIFDNPGAVLDAMAERRDLRTVDDEVEEMLAEGLGKLPRPFRRRMLLAYLGFPFYDVTTLPLVRNEGLTEFDPVKVDRISPDDARSIREGGTAATLRGIEFYNFGAFFSRAYRENDYLWGRLHGAERMLDLVLSTLDQQLGDAEILAIRKELFLAIMDEEAGRLRADRELVPGIRAEILAM